MKLRLVKQGEFLGTKCDFYTNDNNEIFMSRTQIGYALQYKDPSNAILKIHNRHKERFDKFSIELTGAQFVTPIYKNRNAEKVFMYTERGIYEVCRKSNQKIADEFNDWVYETIALIKKNGYYIATEKDSKWIGARNEGKKERLSFTDSVQLFTEYATKNGSKSADKYYIHFTNLINEKVGISKGALRDKLSQNILRDISALERVVAMKLPKLINQSIQYKQIYKEIKNLIATI